MLLLPFVIKVDSGSLVGRKTSNILILPIPLSLGIKSIFAVILILKEILLGSGQVDLLNHLLISFGWLEIDQVQVGLSFFTQKCLGDSGWGSLFSSRGGMGHFPRFSEPFSLIMDNYISDFLMTDKSKQDRLILSF